MPIITKQTDPNLLIPSLLFCDNEYAYDEEFNMPDTGKETSFLKYNTEPSLTIIHENVVPNDTNGERFNETLNEKVDKMGNLMSEIEMHKNALNVCLQEHKNKDISLNNVIIFG